MKNYVVILLGFFLAAPMLGCSKDDTTSPKVGIIYKSGDNDDKNHTGMNYFCLFKTNHA